MRRLRTSRWRCSAGPMKPRPRGTIGKCSVPRSNSCGRPTSGSRRRGAVPWSSKPGSKNSRMPTASWWASLKPCERPRRGSPGSSPSLMTSAFATRRPSLSSAPRPSSSPLRSRPTPLPRPRQSRSSSNSARRRSSWNRSRSAYKNAPNRRRRLSRRSARVRPPRLPLPARSSASSASRSASRRPPSVRSSRRLRRRPRAPRLAGRGSRRSQPPRLRVRVRKRKHRLPQNRRGRTNRRPALREGGAPRSRGGATGVPLAGPLAGAPGAGPCPGAARVGVCAGVQTAAVPPGVEAVHHHWRGRALRMPVRRPAR
mmetsp:Transcript_19214/g.53895  ORF Transcript_19214/g.53895 Transcript_19214/m.53895 type:complete len:313 (-) Transcript_19214:276-1214(-)